MGGDCALDSCRCKLAKYDMRSRREKKDAGLQQKHDLSIPRRRRSVGFPSGRSPPPRGQRSAVSRAPGRLFPCEEWERRDLPVATPFSFELGIGYVFPPGGVRAWKTSLRVDESECASPARSRKSHSAPLPDLSPSHLYPCSRRVHHAITPDTDPVYALRVIDHSESGAWERGVY